MISSIQKLLVIKNENIQKKYTNKSEEARQSDLTVILTAWRRNHLEEQVLAILNQSLNPSEIWLYHCGKHLNLKMTLRKYPLVKYIKSDVDFGFFGRFSLAPFTRTKYVWIIDDDVIPGKDWIKTSLRISKEYNAIVSSAGRVLLNDGTSPEAHLDPKSIHEYFVGDNINHYQYNFNPENKIVDFGCNSWFFERDWLKYFWQIFPYTFLNGEDIHLSATCKILGDIRTVVPEQKSGDTCGNLKKGYGFDNLATWKRDDFIEQRKEVINFFLTQFKWKYLNYHT